MLGKIDKILIARFAYQGDVKTGKCIDVAGEILTLFRDWLEKEIGELKVIGDEEIRGCHFSLGWHPSVDISAAKLVAQAQLDYIKKHFEEMK